MKKHLLLSALVLTGATQVMAQEVHRCYTHEAITEYNNTHPGYLESIDAAFYRAKSHHSQDRSTVYTIPVVVHIVYNTPEENLHDSVIFNQIERLNEDFRRLNEDTTNTRSEFETIVGDSYIQFELASFDPNGNPTTGITRTATDQTSFLGVGTFPADGVKSSADGGIDPWDQSRYLNIWVCDMSFFGSPFVLGYATPPADLPHWPAGSTDGLGDGVVIQYEAFGSNNPNDLDLGTGAIEVKGRTAVHEIGHYLGLRHIWGDGDCTAEDGVDDTPNADAQSDQDCNFTSNTCTDNIGTLGDLPDMVENYMDYSAETCQNSFTLGQIDMMRNILEVYREDLINNNPALGIGSEVEFTFAIYPNPSDNLVTIQGLPDGQKQIIIHNEIGAIVNDIQLTSSNYTIDNLSSGFYFVTVILGEKKSVQKLIIL